MLGIERANLAAQVVLPHGTCLVIVAIARNIVGIK